MNANVISDREYEKYLKEIRELSAKELTAGSSEAERLKLISLAVQAYEKQRFPFERPSPLEAIKFRMDEMGLTQKDLAPYLGGKNRVSEILSKTRPLTLPMIKALHKYLKIPLEVLMQEETSTEVSFDPEQFEFDESLIKEIQKRGWIKREPLEPNDYRKVIGNFLKPIGGFSSNNVLFRKSFQANVRGISKAAAFLWSSQVLLEGLKLEAGSFDQNRIDAEFLKSIAKLSYFDKGPILAREELLKSGIKLVIVPHLTSTYLDGGIVADKEGQPVIGLTLRYDRLDNFWQTLMHELVHIHKHFKILNGLFLDDSDVKEPADPVEKEADQIARDTFIPKSVWRSSDVLHFRTAESIIKLAKDLHIHPAVIAGRIRFETQKFSIFSDLLGLNTVRKMFGVS